MLATVVSRAQHPAQPQLVYNLGSPYFGFRDNTQFSTDGSLLALNDETRGLRIYDIATGLPMREIGKLGDCSEFELSPDFNTEVV